MQGQFKINDHGIQEEEKELIRNVEVERDLNHNFKLAPIIRHLQEMGIATKDCSIPYKSAQENAFVFCGKDPIKEDSSFSFNDLEQPGNRLTIRLR